jgi:peptide/nickel transport system ATP-binding protein
MNGLELEEVSVRYRRADGAVVRAVDDVSLHVQPARILGLVGETGCGKSSVARVAAGLVPPASGHVRLDGRPLPPLRRRGRPRDDLAVQLIFQDPAASLNPRRRIGALLADGLRAAGLPRKQHEARARALLERVGLSGSAVERHAHEFSGGQRQRIAIARVLAAEPRIIIADEPISALDASAQAQIAELLVSLVRDEGVGLLLISHDLSVVHHVADDVAVMYLGCIVERAPTDALWRGPHHPYSQALIEAVPRTDGRGRLPRALGGEVPDPAAPPEGCRFRPRCAFAFDRCLDVPPPIDTGEGDAACWLNEGEKPWSAPDARSRSV